MTRLFWICVIVSTGSAGFALASAPSPGWAFYEGALIGANVAIVWFNRWHRRRHEARMAHYDALIRQLTEAQYRARRN